MTRHTVQLAWERQPGEAYTDQRYSRRHTLRFDGGAVVAASSSPDVVPLPMSDAGAVDPEEMFVASLSSCHMLWFLSLAATQGWRVDRYEDDAEGLLGRRADGRQAMTRVTLRPRVVVAGERRPTAAELLAVHHAAHAACFIANSVSTEVVCVPRD